MAFNAFASLDGDAISSGPKKAFWQLDFSNEEEVLEWLNEEIAYLKDKNRERHVNIRKNHATYRGIQYNSTDARTREEIADRNAPKKRSRSPRIVCNHMVDFVEQQVSRATKYRGAVHFPPPTEDESDRAVAKVGEQLIEKFWEKERFDDLFRMHVRRLEIASDDFIGVFWNKDKGPYDVAWLKSIFSAAGRSEDPTKMRKAEVYRILREIGDLPRLPLLDPKTGKQQKGAAGDDIWITKAVRRGDVEYRLISSMDMFMQRARNYWESDMGHWREWVHIDTLKAKHPAAAGKIEPDDEGTYYDSESCEEDKAGQYVEVWHTYCRTTAELDQGKYIKWCRTAILTKPRANPNRGWDDIAILPWVRTGKIDTPDVMHGDSLVTYGRIMQSVYNNLVSMDVRKQFLHAHPKWVWPKGMVKVESAVNDTTVMQYKGPVAPQLVVPQLAEGGSDILKDRMMGDYQKVMGTYGVSRGEPPKGVTAAIALTFLEEQENQRADGTIAALTSTQRQVALMTIWLMADHYSDDEGRLVELIGKTKSDLAAQFKIADLRSIGNCSIQNASALPQQKSARTQYLIDVKKEWPGIVPDEVAVDLLGLGEQRRFHSIVTVAVRKADEENDKLMNGARVSAPEPQEYHLIHYRTIIRQMNEPWYDKLVKERKDAHIEHAQAHEMYLCQTALKTPPFYMALAQEFPNFPLYYKGPEAMEFRKLAMSMTSPSAQQGGGQAGPQAPQMAPQAEQPLRPGVEAEGQVAPQGIEPGAEVIQ